MSGNGVLVRNDLGVIRVALDVISVDESAREVKAQGWTLALNAGWQLKRDTKKPDSFTVGRRE